MIVAFLTQLMTFAFQVIWLWMVAIYKAIVPGKMQGYKDVAGQIVLITGSGSGLGRLMSVKFAELGCRLVLWDINQAGNEETAEMVIAKGAKVNMYTVDLSSREEIYKAAGQVKEEVGDVEILVNNAGIVSGKKFLDCSDALIEKTMEVNCNAHFWTVKAFLPSMMSKNKGHVVSLASSAGFFGVAGLSDYCASKFAAVGFMDSLRAELGKLGKDGISTTTVCPYFINTGMFAGVKNRFVPMLEPKEVVAGILDAVLTNQILFMVPRSLYILLLLKGIFPIAVGEKIGRAMEIDKSMDSFVGRSKKD